MNFHLAGLTTKNTKLRDPPLYMMELYRQHNKVLGHGMATSIASFDALDNSEFESGLSAGVACSKVLGFPLLCCPIWGRL